MSVIDEVCLVKGHNTISMIASDVIEPMFKLVVHKYELRCTQCGKTKEETDKYRISGRGKARQRTVKNANSNRLEAGKAGIARETPNPQPVPGVDAPVLEPGVQQNPEHSEAGN
jgi:hypothetical protein